MPQHASHRCVQQARRGFPAAYAVIAMAVGVWLGTLAMSPRAAADDGHRRRAGIRARAARHATRTPRVVTDRRKERWPTLVAPALPGEAECGWVPPPAGRLRFDAQRAWWELASLLEVLPVLPRLDGTAPPSRVDRAAFLVLRPALVPSKPPDERLLGHVARWRSAGAPGAALRGLGAHVLRSLGLASIAGQAVFVLEGTVDADEGEDETGLASLPARPWEAPSAGGDDFEAAPESLRATRGHGAMGVTTRVTLRSAALRLVGTF